MIETLDTERLLLRSITLQDADLLVELDSDPEVMRYLTGRPSTRDEVVSTISDALGCRWIASDKATRSFVGWFGLVPGPDGAYDVGYRLRRRWWGRGLAAEGTAALIEAAFGTLGARRVTAQAMSVNERSRAVMERCGMRLVRIFHLEYEDPLPGTEEGEVEYELTREAWETSRHGPTVG
ncbi:MAG: GNAT family N-acetyltransferase [Acidimicrobiales bacterium]